MFLPYVAALQMLVFHTTNAACCYRCMPNKLNPYFAIISDFCNTFFYLPLAAAVAAAASLIEIVLDDTSTASSRYLQRRQDIDVSNYSRDNKPVNLLSINSRHIAEQLTCTDAVRLYSYNNNNNNNKSSATA